MKNRRIYIHQIFAVILLAVFAIALTPWSSLHHHDEEGLACAKEAKTCTHKVHVGSERHNCLICSAHFEKHFTSASVSPLSVMSDMPLVYLRIVISGSYSQLIRTCLRGPPASSETV